MNAGDEKVYLVKFQGRNVGIKIVHAHNSDTSAASGGSVGWVRSILDRNSTLEGQSYRLVGRGRRVTIRLNGRDRQCAQAHFREDAEHAHG